MPVSSVWLRELRHTSRALSRAPWYSVVVIAVSALSIAFATTVFAIVDGVLFKPFPYPRIQELYSATGPGGYMLSKDEVRQWAETLPGVRVAAYQGVFDIGALGAERPVVLRAAAVDRHFFDVLGVHPVIGGFAPSLFEPGSSPLPVVISDSLWAAAYARRADVVGQPLKVTGAANHMAVPLPPLQVVGVLGRDFVYPTDNRTPDILLPLAVRPGGEGSRNASAAFALLRLPRSWTILDVTRRLNALSKAHGEAAIAPIAITKLLRLSWARGAWIAFGISGLLVVLACLNIASLTIARRRQRLPSLAVRRMLGASRLQLLRLDLLEIAPLLVVGTITGLLTTRPLVATVVSVIPATIVMLKVPQVDWRVAAFAAFACTVTMSAIVLLQQRVFHEADISQLVGRGQSTTARRKRLGFLLVSAQAAIALVLGLGGALLVTSFGSVWRIDPGYDAGRTVFMEVALGPGSPSACTARLNDLVRRLHAVPGVQQVAVFGAPLLDRSWLSPAIKVPAGGTALPVQGIPVAGDFFALMGLRPITGRLPTDGELTSGEPLAVVSERVARAYWPGRNPIGQVLESVGRAPALTVVGVVPESRYSMLDDISHAQIYKPLIAWRRPAILVRGAIGSNVLLRGVLAQVKEPVGALRAMTLREGLAATIRARTFDAWLFGSFALAALILVVVSVLGLVAMTAAARTKEIGIRMALGAQRSRIVALLMREQLLAVFVGLATGTLLSIWNVRLLKSRLYHLSVYDPWVWATAVAVVLAAASLGALLPSVRASGVNPVEAIRVD